MYPHTCNNNNLYFRSNLERWEAQRHHLPHFMVGPLLLIPLGFLVGLLLLVPLDTLFGALLQVCQGLIWAQGLFQEFIMSIRMCCYQNCHSDHLHPAPLL